MSDEKRLIALIGMPSDSPEVATWMGELKAPQPRLKKGDTDANVTLPELGMELVFTDEGFKNEGSELAIGEGALLLTAIMFKFGVPGFKDYAGPLPRGLAWGDTLDQVHKKLGNPAKVHPRMPTEFWTLDGARLSVGYDKGKTAIKRVILEVPQ
jgi:hypothetical protein